MEFPLKGKGPRESSELISNTWDYALPLFLKPSDDYPLANEELQNFKSQCLRFECLSDGTVISLDKNTSDAFFNCGYIINSDYHRKR